MPASMPCRFGFAKRASMFAPLLLATMVAACSGERSAPAGAAPTGGATQVERRIGNATVYATAVQTSSIPAGVAREYGIERSDTVVQLRISPRQDSASGLVSAPMRVQATATDLRGQSQALAMREVSANGLVDHVGAVDIQLPEAVRFDVRITTPEGVTETLRFTREFHAR